MVRRNEVERVAENLTQAHSEAMAESLVLYDAERVEELRQRLGFLERDRARMDEEKLALNERVKDAEYRLTKLEDTWLARAERWVRGLLQRGATA